MPDNSDYFDHDDSMPDFEEDDFQARVWNLLVLINPGDEDTALQQFNRWREQVLDSGEPLEEDSDWLPALMQAIDWQSGFMVERDDLDALVSAVDELAARFNVQVDWGGDLDDEDFVEGIDAPALLSTAYDRLREQNYSLWCVDAGTGGIACWMALVRDDDAMLALCSLLNAEVRPGSDPF